MPAQSTLFNKLYYLLQRSLVDVRTAALSGNHQELFDLADALEVVPTLMADWEHAHLELIRSILADYQAKYPESSSD